MLGRPGHLIRVDSRPRAVGVAASVLALLIAVVPLAHAQTPDASPSPATDRELVEDAAEEAAREATQQLQQEDQSLVTGANLFWLLVVVVLCGTTLLFMTVLRTRPSHAGPGPFRSQVEGMVLSMVVIAVIVLGVTGKLTDEGLASVLAAIVGYAVGRSASTDSGGSVGSGAAGGAAAVTAPAVAAAGSATGELQADTSPEATAEAAMSHEIEDLPPASGLEFEDEEA